VAITRLDGAVVLAGGASRRMGHDKLLDEVGGVTLLRRVVAACACPVVCVGARRPGFDDVSWVQEEPPGGGPGAAIAAGLAAARGPVVAVVAGDLPHLTRELLLELASYGPPGAVAVDDEGREQWLLGVHHGLAADPSARSARAAVERPGLVRVRVAGRATWDCDTPADLARARGEEPA